jgi:hypothetical protein
MDEGARFRPLLLEVVGQTTVDAASALDNVQPRRHRFVRKAGG